MVAFCSPQLSYSNMGWLLEEVEAESLLLSHKKNYVSLDYSLPHQFSSQKQHVEIERTSPSPSPNLVVKKLNHNASERDRRKKINSLISSLRSLLPGEDHTVCNIHHSSIFVFSLNWYLIN